MTGTAVMTEAAVSVIVNVTVVFLTVDAVVASAIVVAVVVSAIAGAVGGRHCYLPVAVLLAAGEPAIVGVALGAGISYLSAAGAAPRMFAVFVVVVGVAVPPQWLVFVVPAPAGERYSFGHQL
jgi:hypothetical protein